MNKELAVEHSTFYRQLASWKKEILGQDVPQKGVYFLKAAKPVSRVLGRDEKGILYIGKGDIFSSQSRLGKLINAINGDEEKAHTAGDNYFKRLKKEFPLETLTAEVRLTEQAEDMEIRELDDYFEKFGELPPLNRRR